MCYINTLSIAQKKTIVLNKKEVVLPAMESKLYNGFDFPKWPILVDDKILCIKEAEWGFLPENVQSIEACKLFRSQFTTLNATAENFLQSKIYKDAAMLRRCIIPSSGFIEWQHQKKAKAKSANKIPYFIQPSNYDLFLMAGFYNSTNFACSFTILTTKANELMEEIHNTKKRMPCILNLEQASNWLSTNNINKIQALAATQIGKDDMKAHTIAKNFKSIENPLAIFNYVDTNIQLNLFE